MKHFRSCILIIVFGLITVACDHSVGDKNAKKVSPNSDLKNPDIEPLKALPKITEPQDLITQALQELIGKPIMINLVSKKEDGGWLVIVGEPKEKNGSKVDYSGTRYQKIIDDGYFEDSFIALIQKPSHQNPKNTLVKLVFGENDSSFVEWPNTYGVPAELLFR